MKSTFLNLLFVLLTRTGLTYSLLLITTCDGMSQATTEVLLIGSYHMAGTDDPLKVNADNVLSTKRQGEISALLDQLQQYQPSKIFIESIPAKQPYWDSLYVLLDENRPPKDKSASSEIYQIGMKLAHRLKLPKAPVGVHWIPSDTTNDSAFDKLFREYRKAVDKESAPLKLDETTLWTDNAKTVLADLQKLYVDVAKLPIKDALTKLNSPDFLRKVYYANNVMIMDKNTYDRG